ncbi:hypothetical protein IAD21_02286 [Abditibacteriota bacterium]|nr:hypothetical protein IAD21_02286 [Abditibacteriota bacterium]
MNIQHSEIEPKSDESASAQNTSAAYEAPAIESVLTPESLEREVHYAGLQNGSGVAKA